jgi:hypothetical protein
MDSPAPPQPAPASRLQRQAQAWVTKYRAQVKQMEDGLAEGVEWHLDDTPPHFLKEPLRSAVLELIPEARERPSQDVGRVPEPNLLAQAAIEIDAALRAMGRTVRVMEPPKGTQPLRATFVQGNRGRAKPQDK